MRSPTIFRYSAERPGPGWHAHGSTSKLLWAVDTNGLCLLLLVKQRWLHVDTGTTRHDRPVWDTPGSHYGLDVMFVVIYVWVTSGLGLHRVDWPWNTESPSRRTVQRQVQRLAADAATWEQAIKTALIEFVAPRHLEELLPAGGIPPPKGRTGRSQDSTFADKLYGGVWLTNELAQNLSITVRSLLVLARRRWPTISTALP